MRPWRSAIVCIFPIIITSIFSFPIIPQLRHATFQQQAIRPVCYPSFPPVASRPSSTLIPSPLPSPSRLLHVFLSPSPLQSTPCQTRLRDSRPSPFLHLSEPSHKPSPSRYPPPRLPVQLHWRGRYHPAGNCSGGPESSLLFFWLGYGLERFCWGKGAWIGWDV